MMNRSTRIRCISLAAYMNCSLARIRCIPLAAYDEPFNSEKRLCPVYTIVSIPFIRENLLHPVYTTGCV